MADAMDRRDAACVDARNTVEHRTIAEVMRSNGASEERIVSFFGYSPLALDAETGAPEVGPDLRNRRRDVTGG
ncbi:hypothetical protein MZTS_12550 [Methylorubrum zatmanii]|nr:hypothetical protein [Methylorubrum zatmanii]